MLIIWFGIGIPISFWAVKQFMLYLDSNYPGIPNEKWDIDYIIMVLFGCLIWPLALYDGLKWRNNKNG